MNDKDLQYGDSSLRAREVMTAKYKLDMNKGATDNGLRFLELIHKVPNWETYLTPKQLEVARKYINCMNANEVDHQLKLNYGTTQQRLFGSGKSSKGAIGRLVDAHNKLESIGYYERLEKKKEAAKVTVPQNPVSEEVMNKVKELISLIISMPDFDSHLEKDEAAKVTQFMAFRSFASAGRYFGLNEVRFANILLDENPGGILYKLRRTAQSTMVNNWEDI